ncbi:unnamed protein product [Cuscuta epithymum]|uniref:Uncharacterized protein n=1 Tax=Cuscuta epithymum TaxID=186058 RepID=A0AAV0F2N7_9ASTE|nr:unnamed protein product [Cuscuta epithymum]
MEDNSGAPGKNHGTTIRRRYLAREFGSRFRSPIDLSVRRSLSPNLRQAEVVSVGEKTLPGALSDHVLKQLADVIQNATEPLRKPSSEKKRVSLKGNSFGDQTDNSRPSDAFSVNYRMTNHHRRSSTSDGKHSSKSMEKANGPAQDESSRPLPFISNEKQGIGLNSVDDNSLTIRNGSPTGGNVQSLSMTSNTRSLSSLHSELLDRWPVRICGKASSDSSNRGKIDMLSRPLQNFSTEGVRFLSESYSSTDSSNFQRLNQSRWQRTTGEKERFGSFSIDSRPSQREKTSDVNLGSLSCHSSPIRMPTLPPSPLPVRVNPSDMKAIPNGASIFLSPSRVLSLDGAIKPLQSSSGDMLSLILSNERPERDSGIHLVGNSSMELENRRKLSLDDNSLSILRERAKLVNRGTRSRPTSPNKASALYVSKEISSQTKALTSAPSRGASPSKVRPSSPSRLPNPTFNFVVNIREKDENHQTEDAHRLGLLRNRYLQWQYANAKADAAILAKNVNTQEKVYNVWKTASNLWQTIIQTRIELQQLRLELKLWSILNKQMFYLEKWATIERNHIRSVLRASQDMKACILLLPMTLGAKGDVQAVKSIVCSAFVIMQHVESSIYLMLSQLEGTSSLVSELADIVAQERAKLGEFKLLMAPIAKMQVEEYNLRTYLMQLGKSLQKR